LRLQTPSIRKKYDDSWLKINVATVENLNEMNINEKRIWYRSQPKIESAEREKNIFVTNLNPASNQNSSSDLKKPAIENK
jgi:hypothetical protein